MIDYIFCNIPTAFIGFLRDRLVFFLENVKNATAIILCEHFVFWKKFIFIF